MSISNPRSRIVVLFIADLEPLIGFTPGSLLTKRYRVFAATHLWMACDVRITPQNIAICAMVIASSNVRVNRYLRSLKNHCKWRVSLI